MDAGVCDVAGFIDSFGSFSCVDEFLVLESAWAKSPSYQAMRGNGLDVPGILFDGFMILGLILGVDLVYHYFTFRRYLRKHHYGKFMEITDSDIYGLPSSNILKELKFAKGDDDLGDPKLVILKRNYAQSYHRFFVMFVVLALVIIILLIAIYILTGLL